MIQIKTISTNNDIIRSDSSRCMICFSLAACHFRAVLLYYNKYS